VPKPTPPAPGRKPDAPAPTSFANDPRAPGQDRDSTVMQAFNALAACAETLVARGPEGPDKQLCMVQLTEAKRLIAQLGGSGAVPKPPSPPKPARG
jgi:hypothetical protein